MMFTENKNSRTVAATTERDNISKGNIQDGSILAHDLDEIKTQIDLCMGMLQILQTAVHPAGGFPACLLRPDQTPAARRVLLRRMGFQAIEDVGNTLLLRGNILVDLSHGYVHGLEGRRYGHDSGPHGYCGEVWRGRGDLRP